MQAIEETRLAKVVNRREVHLISYPTVKFPYNNQAIFKEIETVLNQLQVLRVVARNSIVLEGGRRQNMLISPSTMMMLTSSRG